jgi:hypothetical protein
LPVTVVGLFVAFVLLIATTLLLFGGFVLPFVGSFLRFGRVVLVVPLISAAAVATTPARTAAAAATTPARTAAAATTEGRCGRGSAGRWRGRGSMNRRAQSRRTRARFGLWLHERRGRLRSRVTHELTER